MKNRKILIVVFVMLLAICLSGLILPFKNNDTSVIGKWGIDSYIVNGEIISSNQIGEYYGTDYQEAYNNFSVTFNKDKTAVVLIPSYAGSETAKKECQYEVSGNIIMLISGEESIKAFEIDGDTLHGLDIIPFDGSILKKK